MTTTFSSMNRSNITNSSAKSQKENLPVRIEALAESLEDMQKHLSRLVDQQQSIRQAKINVERYLDQKSEENRQRLLGQLSKYEDQVKRKIQNTRSQTQKIDQKIQILKHGQIQVLQLILGIQRRVQQLQVQLGVQTE